MIHDPHGVTLSANLRLGPLRSACSRIRRQVTHAAPPTRTPLASSTDVSRVIPGSHGGTHQTISEISFLDANINTEPWFDSECTARAKDRWRHVRMIVNGVRGERRGLASTVCYRSTRFVRVGTPTCCRCFANTLFSGVLRSGSLVQGKSTTARSVSRNPLHKIGAGAPSLRGKNRIGYTTTVAYLSY